MKPETMRTAAFESLKSAAFEERVNKHREAADWWRERAAMWLRRSIDETHFK